MAVIKLSLVIIEHVIFAYQNYSSSQYAYPVTENLTSWENEIILLFQFNLSGSMAPNFMEKLGQTDKFENLRFTNQISENWIWERFLYVSTLNSSTAV